MKIGPSAAEPFWADLSRNQSRRSRRGARLVISDAHDGIKAAVTRVLSTTWQRCRVHFKRTALAHVGNRGRQVVCRVVSAFVAIAFAQDTAETAKARWRTVADQLRPSWQP